MDIREIRRINATKHGGYGTRLYGIWNSMRQRCINPSVKEYRYYGVKGVRVCEEWSVFENFRDWALSHGYADNLTIDRIDSTGNYESSNCRWISIQLQRNKTIMSRLARGWSSNRILSTVGDARRNEVKSCVNC